MRSCEFQPDMSLNSFIPVWIQARCRFWPRAPASPGAASGKIVFDADRAESKGTLAKGDSGQGRDQAGRTSTVSSPPGHPHEPREARPLTRCGCQKHGKTLRSGCEAIRINDLAKEAFISGVTLRKET